MDTVKHIVDAVKREDLWMEAAQEADSNCLPDGASCGVETFFGGIQFDPENIGAYVSSLEINLI